MSERLSCKRKEYRKIYRSELRRLRKGRKVGDVVPVSDVVGDVSCSDLLEEEKFGSKLRRLSEVELLGSVIEAVSLSDQDIKEGNGPADVLQACVGDMPPAKKPKLSYSIEEILYGGRKDMSDSVAESEIGSAFRSISGTSGLSRLRRKSVMYIGGYGVHHIG